MNRSCCKLPRGTLGNFGVLALALGVGALFLPCFAHAAIFNVEPIRIELGPDRLTATATLSTPGTEPVLVEAEAFHWSQGDGEDRLQPAADLVVIPPIFTLEPRLEQTIRIGLPGPPQGATHSGAGEPPGEVAWRLLLTEVPNETVESTAVRFTLRLSIPVFFTPPGSQPELRWSLERQTEGPSDDTATVQETVRVSLTNVGTAHAHVLDLEVLDVEPDASEPKARAGHGGYILPGTRRSWILSADALGDATQVRLRAPTRGGEPVLGVVSTGQVPLADGAPER